MGIYCTTIKKEKFPQLLKLLLSNKANSYETSKNSSFLKTYEKFVSLINPQKMDIQSEKLKLIEWLISLQDQTVIEKLKFLRDNLSDTSDWWDTISEAEKESIDRGLKDIDSGRITPHSEVRKKYGKWL